MLTNGPTGMWEATLYLLMMLGVFVALVAAIGMLILVTELIDKYQSKKREQKWRARWEQNRNLEDAAKEKNGTPNH